MYVSANQFYVFLACISFGGVFGCFFSIISLVKKRIKAYPVKILLDILFFLLLSGGYVVYSFCCNFPSLRGYMPIGVILGIFLYMKSFHLILAKCLKKTYNKYVRKINARKETNDERRKV